MPAGWGLDGGPLPPGGPASRAAAGARTRFVIIRRPGRTHRALHGQRRSGDLGPPRRIARRRATSARTRTLPRPTSRDSTDRSRFKTASYAMNRSPCDSSSARTCPFFNGTSVPAANDAPAPRRIARSVRPRRFAGPINHPSRREAFAFFHLWRDHPLRARSRARHRRRPRPSASFALE